MTIENKRLIELTDISAIEYVCRACQTKVSVPRLEWKAIPTGCPRCFHIQNSKDYVPWFPVGTDRTEKLVRQLLVAVDALVAEKNDRAFDIRFEVPIGSQLP